MKYIRVYCVHMITLQLVYTKLYIKLFCINIYIYIYIYIYILFFGKGTCNKSIAIQYVINVFDFKCVLRRGYFLSIIISWIFNSNIKICWLIMKHLTDQCSNRSKQVPTFQIFKSIVLVSIFNVDIREITKKLLYIMVDSMQNSVFIFHNAQMNYHF